MCSSDLAKSTADYYLADDEKKEAESALTKLVQERKGLRPALEALATGEASDPIPPPGYGRGIGA